MALQDDDHEHGVDGDRRDAAGVDDVEPLCTLQEAGEEPERCLEPKSQRRDDRGDLGGPFEIRRQIDHHRQEPGDHEADGDGEQP